MKISDFDYTLPPERIAQQPLRVRDQSRLLVIDRSKKELSHHRFFELPQLLKSGDVLVINDTKVLPTRLKTYKSTGGQVEVLLTKKLTSNASDHKVKWECLSKPGLKINQTVFIGQDKQKLTITCLRTDGYRRVVELTSPIEKTQLTVMELIKKYGQMPTPPYIKSFSGDPDRYQTIYAKHEGSAAAPTAGLHFTNQLKKELVKTGVAIVPITLTVGLGTFFRVTQKNINRQVLHSEEFSISKSQAETINQAIRENKRIIAVGTTSLRALESAAEFDDVSGRYLVRPSNQETEIFIFPPYKFKIATGLITNFHLPQSSLLMLVSAFISHPNTEQPFINFQESLLGNAYQEAIQQKYRFYSFGDAMLIE